jgi:hypothetical protein
MSHFFYAQECGRIQTEWKYQPYVRFKHLFDEVLQMWYNHNAATIVVVKTGMSAMDSHDSHGNEI